MFDFLKRLSLFTIIIGLAIFAWNKFMEPEMAFNKAWYILAFFFILTALLHWGYTQAGATGGQHFIRYFLATTTLKLFLLLLIIVVYVMRRPADAMHFAVCFLILYLFYTAFETFHLLKHFNNK
jgi:hypothetical protein